MYNTVTVDLIKGAPNVGDFDSDTLPHLLAEAYSRIVSSRVSLASAEAEEISSLLWTVKKLGFTYLGMLNFIDPETRKSVAFVAGTAFELLHTYHGRHEYELFTETTVCTACIASLLFLIADAPSDAIEVMGTLTTSNARPSVTTKMQELLTLLAKGQLEDVLAVSIDVAYGKEIESVACGVLYSQAMHGLKVLAEAILGRAPLIGATSIFRFAKDQCTDNCSDLMDGYFPVDSTLVSTFPGPFILSLLLEKVAEELFKHAVVNISVPIVSDQEQWREELVRISKLRPYLWENHLRIIENEQFLDVGISSVLSLPTGAGKTSLAHLKALTTLADGKKVIFLAPTHALVRQVSKDFRSFFPEVNVFNSFLSEGEYAETEDYVLPDIAVMTPERYLTLTMLAPEAFEEVGLLIIDECHILHARSLETSYRATDAMIGLIRSFDVAKNADFLLMSAMISNPTEIASWLASQTNRRCISVLDEWKPTRQARCCVIYSAEEIEKLQTLLRQARRQGLLRPNAEVQRQLAAHPLGFFSLDQTWTSTDLEGDYVVLPLSDAPVPLNANASWRLTSNRNAVSAKIAAKLARAGIRTIVFSQQVNHTASIAKQVQEEIPESGEVQLNDRELELKTRLVHEFGEESSIFLPYGVAACHHGLLFPDERELSEGLFARGGIMVLAATPTLAQGMNLPAEAVVIAGDERFDEEQGQEQLEPHEILNAAGRAGRAGHRAQGIVVVVPGTVVDYESSTATLSAGWHSLRENVFSQLDQCLDVADPLELLLDTIQSGATLNMRPFEYIFRRVGSISDESEGTQSVFGKSFGRHRAVIYGSQVDFDRKVANAIKFGEQFVDSGTDEFPTWISDVGKELGFPPEIVNELYRHAYQGCEDQLLAHFFWFVDTGLLYAMIKDKTYSDLTKGLLSVAERKARNKDQLLSQRLKETVRLWISGGTIREMCESACNNDPPTAIIGVQN